VGTENHFLLNSSVNSTMASLAPAATGDLANNDIPVHPQMTVEDRKIIFQACGSTSHGEWQIEERNFSRVGQAAQIQTLYYC
jgi:hypothetical protein